MPIKGDLKTMSLVELLQWAGMNRKTGLLELERNKIRTSIAFRDGRIAGCSSTDPSALLGHFLISRGKITSRTLQYALKQQGDSNERLSDILVEMGLLTEGDVKSAVAESALETIFGVFEWERAVFRFELGATLDNVVPMDVSVDNTLMTGAQRQDELQMFRDAFPSSGVVLQRTEQALPANPENGTQLFSLLDWVNGERTLAEIMIQAHASEYQVLKVLFSLKGSGNVKVIEERPVADGPRTILDQVDEESIALPSLPDVFGEDDEAPTNIDKPARKKKTKKTEDTAAAAPSSTSATLDADADELSILMQFATERFENGDHEGALSMLDGCYQARPEDDALKALIEKIEGSYLDKVKEFLLPPERVPVLAIPHDELSGHDLLPTETSILGLIDGKTNVQSIVWIATLREVMVMRTLQQLHERGLIAMESPVTA